MAFTRSSEIVAIGSVSVGTTFVFRATEVLGAEYASMRNPPYDGQAITIAGFRPRFKSNVVVQERNGKHSLMPLEMVERALSLQVSE
jgi:hypothetical protein